MIPSTKNSVRITTKIILFSILSSLIFVSCEESLPTRDETPVDIFSSFLTTVDGRTSFRVTRDPASINEPHPPPVRIRFGVINIFDETLQGTPDIINGSIDIWIANDTNQAGKTYLLTKDSEIPPIGTPPLIENASLTIDPGDTFFVEISWPHEVNGTTKVWEYLGIGNGSSRLVNISVLAKIQLFEELPPIVSDLLQLRITYVKNS